MRPDFATLFAAVAIVAVVASILYFNPFGIPATTSNEAKRFASYEDMQNFLKTNVAESSYYGGVFSSRQALGTAATTAPTAAGATKNEGTATSGAAADDYSQTNIQVAGVDEADIVKNDGKYIYTASGSNLTIVDAYPADQMKILSTLSFDGSVSGIFVNGDRLAVFGNVYYNYPYPVPLREGETATQSAIRCIDCILPPIYYHPRSFIYIYDISDRANPTLARNITVDGSYFDSRMIGDYVYAVVNSYINNVDNVTVPIVYDNGVEKHTAATDVLYFDYPDSSYQFTTILSANIKDDGQEPGKQEILMGATQTLFVSQDNIYITYQKPFDYYDYQNRLLDAAVVPYLPVDVQTQIDNIRNSDIPKYEKYQNITDVLQTYVMSLTEDQRASLEQNIESKIADAQMQIQKEVQKTIIHRIAIDESGNGSIEYKSNGEVPGYVLNQFSMDEYNGYFRIATTTRNSFWGGPVVMIQTGTVRAGTSASGGASGSATAGSGVATSTVSQESAIPDSQSKISFQAIVPSPPSGSQSLNNVYVLDMDMNVVGRLENLAPDESIYSARFIGDRVYLVTFRKIDPLFVIDLSNPADPKVLGQLKIPGFSDYLHPVDETHIIGLGQMTQDMGQFIEPAGIKLGLFDVSDPTNPIEVANYTIGDFGTYSEALNDHKAFLFSKDKNLLVIPILLVENPLHDFGIRGYTWQGAYVFDTSNNQFAIKGRITHAPANATDNYYYYYGPYSVRRSLYIGNALYTISDGLIKANDLQGQNLPEINSVQLPVAEFGPIVYAQ